MTCCSKKLGNDGIHSVVVHLFNARRSHENRKKEVEAAHQQVAQHAPLHDGLGRNKVRARADHNAMAFFGKNARHLTRQDAQVGKARRAVGIGKEDKGAAAVQHAMTHRCTFAAVRM